MIGKQIKHYLIKEKLGEGGMGVVYKAEDMKLKRTVALKFLPSELTRDPEAKQRFIQEAQAASTFDHPNICTIYEIDETEGGQMFIAMAYYEGETLKKKMEYGLFSLIACLNIAIQIAQGLTKTHKGGIIHRDIKPTNVMITDDGMVKILDFGIAKLTWQDGLTRAGATLGTISYMSPEQSYGREVDHRTDIWALGVVLYEMITGQLPFKADYDQATINLIQNEKPTPISKLRDGIPIELERIVKKALAKNPDERYRYANEIAVDLKRLIKKLENNIKTQPAKTQEKKIRKKWLNIILIPVGILILTVLGIILFKPQLFENTFFKKPTSIAVITFENHTGDKSQDYLQKAIPNLLITRLEQSRYLQVTTWERIYDLLKQMGKGDVELIDRNLGFELCRMDNVKVIVIGDFTKAGDIFTINAVIYDVKTRKRLKLVSSQGESEASIFKEQIDELSKQISQGIGLSEHDIRLHQRSITKLTTTSLDAYNYFVSGKDAYEKLYYNDARQFLEKAIQLDSTFSVAYLYLARAYSGLGYNRRSIEAYKQAKKFSEQATEKEKFYIEAAYANKIEKNQQKRLHIFKQMIKKYPKEKQAHYELAMYYKSNRLFTEALSEFNKVLELDPNYGFAINNIAYTYAEQDEFERAIEYFERYSRVSPGDANPFDTMGDIYIKMGKLDDAINMYQEALKIKPDFGSDWKLAYFFALKEDYPEAMKWINHYITIAPSEAIKAIGYWYKGFYHYWLGNLDSCFAQLPKAMDFANRAGNNFWFVKVDWLKAWIYYDRGKPELSKEHFKRWTDYANRAFPNAKLGNQSCWIFLLGLIYLKEEQIDSAKVRLIEMNSIISKLQTSGSGGLLFYNNLLRGEVMLVENRHQEIITEWEKLLPWEIPFSSTTVPSYNVPFLKDVLARAYLATGEIDKAIAEYESLTTFNLSNNQQRLIYPLYHYRLAKLYEKKGSLDKARREYIKFLEIWKNADEDLTEKIDAKQKLVNLR